MPRFPRSVTRTAVKTGALLALLASALLPSGTAVWEMNSYGDFVRGRFTGISLSREGRLSLAPKLDTVFTSDQAVIWGLVPISFMYGQKVLAWSKVGWFAIYATGMLLFVHTLLHPGMGLYGSSSDASLVSVTLLFVSFGAFSLLFWAYFRFRRPRQPVTPNRAPSGLNVAEQESASELPIGRREIVGQLLPQLLVVVAHGRDGSERRRPCARL